VTEPRVILADEPTGNLDSRSGAALIELLAGLAARRGTTVVVATHDAGLAARAPRRLAMRDGRIVPLSATAPLAGLVAAEEPPTVRDAEGAGGDSNPRPPGPQPGSTSVAVRRGASDPHG
jgi:putative ABC transport system ATP-binding protein